MSNMLSIAPSPHVHGVFSTRRLMVDVLIALAPAWLVGLWFFGLGAFIITIISVGCCVGFEYLIQRFILKQTPTITDGSAAVTGLLLALNLPSNLPWWIVVIGAIMAIGVGKMSFGGLGNNLFNPALFARAFLLVSFPVHMTSWPLPLADRLAYTDAVTGATPLALLKGAAKGGSSISALGDSLPSVSRLLFGEMGGSFGEVCAIALLLGFAYLLIRRVITWHIPVSIFATVVVFSGILWLVNPERFANPVIELFTGGLMLGAIFMATDYVSSPMSKLGMLIYGVGIGVLTILIRSFGAYPEGVSFAILIMNGFTPLLNRYVKPPKFGRVKPAKAPKPAIAAK